MPNFRLERQKELENKYNASRALAAELLVTKPLRTLSFDNERGYWDEELDNAEYEVNKARERLIEFHACAPGPSGGYKSLRSTNPLIYLPMMVATLF